MPTRPPATASSSAAAVDGRRGGGVVSCERISPSRVSTTASPGSTRQTAAKKVASVSSHAPVSMNRRTTSRSGAGGTPARISAPGSEATSQPSACRA